METSKKKVLFLIPDGVGVRNYLYSNVLDCIKEASDIAFWSPLPVNAFAEVLTHHNIDIQYKNLKLNTESILTRLYNESATYARLLHNVTLVSNPTILINWRKKNKKFGLRQLYTLAEYIGRWASKKYSRILDLEDKAKKHWKRSIIDGYKKDLKQLNPSSIFITHQRVAALMPICMAARELNIPVITAIYSWDNLPKARLVVQADKYVVWSTYMKEEIKTYYPEINMDDVLVTGTPQFEFYNNKNLIVSREAFALKYGLDKGKKWICFSGDDKMSSPNDPFYLRDVMQSVQNTNNLNNTQIIFRRSPSDFSDRYDQVLSDYINIVSIDPLWNSAASEWNFFFPKYADVGLLVNIVYHCQLVVNVGSTMAHDFAVLNKPCLYLCYDKKENVKWSSKVVYNYQHFRTMENLDGVGWLNSSKEIAQKLLLSLNSPEELGKDRKKWLEKILLHPLEESSYNIAKVLLNHK